jgi:nitrite reductase (cytochrome c-552)
VSEETKTEPANVDPRRRRRIIWGLVLLALLATIVAALASAMLVNIWTRKQEALNTFVRLVDVNENTSDPVPWGTNFPREYDQYLRTVDATKSRYGGSDGMPAQKLDRDPWLRRMFAGYAFSLDFRDRRGHAYMLFDQTRTERVLQRPQPGACLHCHASIIPTYRRIGAAALGIQPQSPNDFDWTSVMKGFEVVTAMKYTDAFAEIQKTPDGALPNEKQTPTGSNDLPETAPRGDPTAPPTTQQALAAHKVGNAHPVSCVDCHDPQTMELRVTRPGFIHGIQALANSEDPVAHLPSIGRWRLGNRAQPYDPNREASRQEMRSFVCGQCHVEYYCGPKVTMFFPWNNGLKVEQIESYYDNYKFPDGHRFFDFAHGETGAEVIKAQHPEFETWSQGTHAKAGVACADCHMPYMRQGAVKISDHWVRSPALNIARACQQCHPTSELELQARIDIIQSRTHDLMERGGVALVAMIDSIKSAKASGATQQQLQPALELQRKAQWRLDFVNAENSMGFHAAQETARILGESIDFSRQAQIEAIRVTPGAVPPPPATMPAGQPVLGVTPADQAPPGSNIP